MDDQSTEAEENICYCVPEADRACLPSGGEWFSPTGQIGHVVARVDCAFNVAEAPHINPCNVEYYPKAACARAAIVALFSALLFLPITLILLQ